jgi:hypothetical protein
MRARDVCARPGARARTAGAAAVGVLALAAWGCGPTAAAGAPDLGATLADGPGSGDAVLAECKDELGQRVLGGVCLRSVSGQLVDDAGAGLPAVTMTVCAEACFYGKTDDRGAFSVAVGQYLLAEHYSLLAHVNPRRAAFYLALPTAVDGAVVFPAPIVAPPMPAAGPAIASDGSAQTVSQGGLTLTIEAGTTLFFSTEDFAEQPLGVQFRPLRLPPAQAAALLGVLTPLPALVYGFGPFEIDFRQPVRLSFDNPLGLPAGSNVEILAQRGLIRGGPPGARFDVIASAAVSSDGSRIEMAPGAGLDTLTWIALRPKGP